MGEASKQYEAELFGSIYSFTQHEAGGRMLENIKGIFGSEQFLLFMMLIINFSAIYLFAV